MDWEKQDEFEQDGFTVRIETMPDDHPDLSWLGEFTDKPKMPYYDRAADFLVYNERTEKIAEQLAEEAGWDSRRYRYIHGFQHKPGEGGITARQAYRYCRQDARRLDRYDNGEWHMVGVRAVASIAEVDLGESGGIWGVESDSGDYIVRDVGKEQASEAIDEAKEKLEHIVQLHAQSKTV